MILVFVPRPLLARFLGQFTFVKRGVIQGIMLHLEFDLAVLEGVNSGLPRTCSEKS